jgi:hypothetical protein
MTLLFTAFSCGVLLLALDLWTAPKYDAAARRALKESRRAA